MQQINTSVEIGNLTNKELYTLCQQYGGNAKDWLKKFAGLLPEVYKRKLHKIYGFISIDAFAKKLAGMNERTTYKILNLARKLENTPRILKLLTNGEVGWSKIDKIAGIANKENEDILIEKVNNLSQKILAIYAKEQRRLSVDGQLDNSLTASQKYYQGQLSLDENNEIIDQQPNENGKAKFYTEIHEKFTFSLNNKTHKKLQYVKSILEKKLGRPLSWNETFNFWPIHGKKEKQIVLKICPDCAKKKGLESQTRHIPINVRRILTAKYKDCCAFPKCYKTIAEFHHLKRYALEKNHNPDHIVPLCATHHSLVHAGLILNEDDPVEKWIIGDAKQNIKTSIDKKVQEHKQNLHSRI